MTKGAIRKREKRKLASDEDKKKEAERKKKARDLETAEETSERNAKNAKRNNENRKKESAEKKSARNEANRLNMREKREVKKLAKLQNQALAAQKLTKAQAEFQNIQTRPKALGSKNLNLSCGSEVSKGLSHKAGLPRRNDGTPSSGSDDDCLITKN